MHSRNNKRMNIKHTSIESVSLRSLRMLLKVHMAEVQPYTCRSSTPNYLQNRIYPLLKHYFWLLKSLFMTPASQTQTAFRWVKNRRIEIESNGEGYQKKERKRRSEARTFFHNTNRHDFAFSSKKYTSYLLLVKNLCSIWINNLYYTQKSLQQQTVTHFTVWMK